MIIEIIGMIFGALAGSYIVFSLFSFGIDSLTRFTMKINKNLNISFVLSIIFVLLLGNLWGLTPDQSFIRYVPGITIMYLYDRRRRLTKKCPNCKERIKLDSLVCKHCKSELNNIAREGNKTVSQI